VNDPLYRARPCRALAWAAAAIAVAGSSASVRAQSINSQGNSNARATEAAVPAVVHEAASTSGPAMHELGARPFGRSGKLRFAVQAGESRSMAIPVLQRLFGDSAVRRPGVYTTRDAGTGTPFSLITMLPFSEKRGARLGAYKVGYWPNERRGHAGANPDGFIVVTPENQDTHVSEHFRLRDFLTKDQQAVWPKYLVLRPELIDKLELVMAELNASGVKATRMTVMSGFRTPQYNQQGVGRGGRAQDSRHQYGDAADVFVDNNGDGRLDDLNGDRRVDTRDVRVMLEAVERVERAWPDLVGGAGLYRATRAHGPFAHVDVRGDRARWGGA
jgi:hypothetical protein